MPALTTDQLTLAIIIIGAVAGLCLIVSLVLALRLRRFRRRYALVHEGGRKTDLLAALAATKADVGSIDRRLQELASAQQESRTGAREGLHRFGLVRYDAFDDMGGQLSFSLALLTGTGDGVVVTSINGRSDTRSYAKEIAGRASLHNLSEEELAAIDLASSDAGRSSGTVVVSR